MEGDDDLYDEFGNYIGPEPSYVAPGATQEEPQLEEVGMDGLDERFAMVTVEEDRMRGVVLHEDREYYASAEATYGPGVQVVVQEADTQHLSQPIIAPRSELKYEHQQGVLDRTYSDEYLYSLLEVPERVRNVALLGGLHAGKTSLLDVVLMASHGSILQARTSEEKTARWMDNRVLEQQRGITLYGKALCLAAEDPNGTSYAMNFYDSPGHADFLADASLGLEMAEGCLVVLDVTEGLTLAVEEQLRRAAGKPLVLLLNKVDRLWMELRLPPADAYYRLRHVIEEVNTFLRPLCGAVLSPELGNVLFGSTLHGWIFSLASFARMYLLRSASGRTLTCSMDPDELAKRLWGDIYWLDGKFKRSGGKRSFVAWILEPLYKLHAQLIGEDVPQLTATLGKLGIKLTPAEHKMNTRPLIALVMQKWLGPAVPSLVDALREHVPSFASTQSSEKALVALKGLPSGEVLLRVKQGSVTVGDDLYVCQAEEAPPATVSALWLPCGRYRIAVHSAPVGSVVLAAGLDPVFPGHPVTLSDKPSNCPPFLVDEPLVRVALEPVRPSDLPKMLSGLRSLCKSIPGLAMRAEESGEQALLGHGELQLDSALHDLRTLHAPGLEVRLAEPSVLLAESVQDTSILKCFADTPNQRNRLTVLAEPLEKGLAEMLESGEFSKLSSHEQEKVLRGRFGWDVLAARSLWALGPDPQRGPNILLEDCLPDETDKELLAQVKPLIAQGFQWAMREGPLLEAPVRGVKLRLVDALLAAEPQHRAAGQLVPAMRRACHAALLTASPRLAEPLILSEITCPPDVVDVVYQLVAKRRGHILQQTPRHGSPLTVLRASIPLLDSFGLECDLRTNTLGAALIQSIPAGWHLVPGDPLDASLTLVPLEPAPAPALARDLLLKVRRRKGLAPNLSLAPFFDDPMLLQLAKENIQL